MLCLVLISLFQELVTYLGTFDLEIEEGIHCFVTQFFSELSLFIVVFTEQSSHICFFFE